MEERQTYHTFRPRFLCPRRPPCRSLGEAGITASGRTDLSGEFSSRVEKKSIALFFLAVVSGDGKAYFSTNRSSRGRSASEDHRGFFRAGQLADIRDQHRQDD